jgi:hypothetical protein
MTKRNGKKRQRRDGDRAARPAITFPLAIPAYWTPEEALAVFELVDDLRDHVWAIYQSGLQNLIRRQRHPGPVDSIVIDEDDLPF